MKLNILLISFVIILIVTPLVIQSESEFVGTDDIATGIIEEIVPGYTPWIDNFWSPSSGEVESMLFAFQAAAGALFIGYYIGFSKAKRKFQTGSKNNDPC